MSDASLPELIFQKDGIIAITLMRRSNYSGQITQKSSGKSLEKSSLKIIGLLGKDPAMTTIELSWELSVSIRANEQIIAK
jgi:hypothetical protein